MAKMTVNPPTGPRTKLDQLLDIATARNLELVVEVRRLTRLNAALARRLARLEARIRPIPKR